MLAVILSLPSAEVRIKLVAQPLAPPHVELLHAPTVTSKQVTPNSLLIEGMQMPPLSPLDTRLITAPMSLSMPGLVMRACMPPSIT